jgi:hypothetical protein
MAWRNRQRETIVEVQPNGRTSAVVKLHDGDLARSTGMAEALGFVLRGIREHDPNAS